MQGYLQQTTFNFSDHKRNESFIWFVRLTERCYALFLGSLSLRSYEYKGWWEQMMIEPHPGGSGPFLNIEIRDQDLLQGISHVQPLHLQSRFYIIHSINLPMGYIWPKDAVWKRKKKKKPIAAQRETVKCNCNSSVILVELLIALLCMEPWAAFKQSSKLTWRCLQLLASGSYQ